METKLLLEVANRLIERFKVKVIILFGSRARGEWKPWSDFDLLIIADFDENYLERLKSILDCLGDVKLPVEPHPYTINEALEMLRKGNPAIIDALENGVILYAGEEYEKLKNAYLQMKKKGLRKSKTTIILPLNQYS